ncbi:hypothetical protein RB195_020522 [Necator americanus]|uniref:HECT-type E3 ubiquitin transferase n=1 Tax=Necator americanus TaxID=51031 RepID=A0ABR1CJA0_NECAM
MSFLNLVDFDGSIKRNKKQEAVLNTFNDRERFLRELEAQRKARAVDQKQQKAAIVVQRSWKAYKARTEIAEQLREEFDEIGRPTTKEALNLQMTRINVFYHHPDDDSRLVTLCSAALGLFRAHGEQSGLLSAQGKMVFYKCLLRYLSHAGKETNFVMPIRFLETFLEPRDSIHITKLGYFKSMLELVAKLAPERDKGAPIVIETRLSPRLDSLCEQLLLPIMRSSGRERISIIRSLIGSICASEHSAVMASLVIPYYCRSLGAARISLRDTLDAFGTKPTADTVPAGITSTYFLGLLFGICEHCAVSDEDKFLLLSTCAGYKQVMQHLESEDKVTALADEKAQAFMITSINASFESPAFSALCKNAVLFPTDENVWSLVAFEKQIRNSDTMMMLGTSSACMNKLWQILMNLQSRCASGRLSNHIDLLKMGHPLDDASRDQLTQALSLFCGCLVACITSVDDADFAAGHPNIIFSNEKLREMITVIRDVGLGLIDLAFPEDFFVTAKAAEERNRDAAKREINSAIEIFHGSPSLEGSQPVSREATWRVPGWRIGG